MNIGDNVFRRSKLGTSRWSNLLTAVVLVTGIAFYNVSAAPVLDGGQCAQFYSPPKNVKIVTPLKGFDDTILDFALKQYLIGQKEPAQKSEFSATLKNYLKGASRDDVMLAAQKRLGEAGIAFDIINSRIYKGRESIAPAPYLTAIKIRPSADPNAHPLSRIAERMLQDLGVSLIFDFSYLDKRQIQGSFFPIQKAIYFSTGFVEHLRIDSNFMHELLHAYAGFLRETGDRDNVLNTTLRPPSQDKDASIGYDSYMSFEELLAHPLSVRLSTWELNRAARDDGKISQEKLNEFNLRVLGAKNVVRVAKESFEENLNALNSGSYTIKVSDDGKKILLVARTQRVSPLNVTITNHELVARARRDVNSVRSEVIKIAFSRVQDLQKLATKQSDVLAELGDLGKNIATPTDIKRIERISKDFFQHTLDAVKASAPVEIKKEIQKTIPTLPIEVQGRALNLLARQKDEFEKLLRTSGFNSLEEIQRAVDQVAARNDQVRAMRDSIRNNQLEIIIYRNSRSRENIRLNGFLNSHQSGRSGGDLNPERRIHAEAGYLNLSADEYRRIDNAAKPKYMIARFKGEPNDQRLSYGEDLYIFSAERQAPHLTFTLGDSLDKTPYIPGNRDLKGWRANSWDQLFVPWKYRELMIPELWPGYNHNQTLMLPTTTPLTQLQSFFQKRGAELFGAYRKSLTNNSATYLEVQRFDDLPFAEIVGFQFNKTPPSGAFLKDLLSKDVTIYDGRSGERKIWRPSPAELSRLLAQVETPKSRARLDVVELSRETSPDDLLRLTWFQGSAETRARGWFKRFLKKGGSDFIEIIQSYRGDEHIEVQIPVDDIIEFQNSATGFKASIR